MHKFSPQNAERLERPERYRLIPPEETLRRFGLRPGMSFLDVGAGTGFFSGAAATLVGPEGKVYAVDMSPELLHILRTRLASPVIRPVLSEEYSIPLPGGSADLALLAFVLHENADRKLLLDEVARIVRPGGRIVIIEWKKQEEESGPPMEERLGEEELRRDLGRFVLADAGPLNASHYYAVIEQGPSSL